MFIIVILLAVIACMSITLFFGTAYMLTIYFKERLTQEKELNDMRLQQQALTAATEHAAEATAQVHSFCKDAFDTIDEKFGEIFNAMSSDRNLASLLNTFGTTPKKSQN